MILPDVLDYNLNIVFCGMAASKQSMIRRSYYAGRGNKFWKTLYDIEITSKKLDPEEFKKLLHFKCGLTDICKIDFGNDNELDKSTYDVNGFNSKILKFQPKIVCFNGKNAGKTYLNKKIVTYGIQLESINSSKVYIAPSTSGAASGFWNMKIWNDLLNYI